jgi:predicted nucleic acid-binding Zn ribbon protein
MKKPPANASSDQVSDYINYCKKRLKQKNNFIDQLSDDEFETLFNYYLDQTVYGEPKELTRQVYLSERARRVAEKSQKEQRINNWLVATLIFIQTLVMIYKK